MVREKNPTNFMNGVPELLLLGMLADGSEMYGYELAREVRDRTGGALSMSEGVIYPTLHTLELDRLVGTRRREVNGRPRIYYRLTARGKRRLAAATHDWSRVARAIKLILGDSADVIKPV